MRDWYSDPLNFKTPLSPPSPALPTSPSGFYLYDLWPTHFNPSGKCRSMDLSVKKQEKDFFFFKKRMLSDVHDTVTQITLKSPMWALAGVVQWVGYCPAKRVHSRSGHMPGSLVGGKWEATNQCFSHTSMFLSLSSSLPLFLKNK